MPGKRVTIPTSKLPVLRRVKGGQRAKRNTGPALFPRIPITPNFNRRRTNLTIDVRAALKVKGRGLRPPRALDMKIRREEAYQKWLRRVGPQGSSGTRPEFMVFVALERTGLRSPLSTPSGLDFFYQIPLLGGRLVKGGAVADFVVTAPQVGQPLVLRIQGEYFHFIDVVEKEAGEVQRWALEGAGYRVVDILAQDTLTEQRCDEVVGYALMGIELDETGRLSNLR